MPILFVSRLIQYVVIKTYARDGNFCHSTNVFLGLDIKLADFCFGNGKRGQDRCIPDPK